MMIILNFGAKVRKIPKKIYTFRGKFVILQADKRVVKLLSCSVSRYE